jgi:hypothetical protein
MLYTSLCLSFFGKVRSVDNWAHLGGFIAGFAMGIFKFRSLMRGQWKKRVWLLLACAAVAGLISLLVMLFLLRVQDLRIDC